MKPAVRFALFAAVFVFATVLILWSWNTLAGLFAGPEAQYRHALAAAALLVLVKWTLAGGRRHRCLRRGR